MDRCLPAMFRYRRLCFGAATAIIVFGATDIVAQTPAPTVPQPPVNEYGQQQQLQQQERRQQLLQPQQLPLEQQQQRAGQPAGAATDDANAGEAALNRNDYNTAIEMFTRAVASGGLSPADAESAYVERAKAYIGLGNGAAAQSDLNQAQQLNPNDPDIGDLLTAAQSTGGVKSASNAGSSLKDTVTFLVQAVVGQGSGYSNVRADPSSCRIDFHHKAIKDGKVNLEEDVGISLGSILPVRRLSSEEHRQELFAALAPFLPVPPPNPQEKIYPLVSIHTDKGGEIFRFTDPDLADQVAAAFQHAAELCGAKQQPF